MDWSNESYVRVYTRDTGDLLAVGWEGRAVLWELMRKADRAGVLDHGGDVELVAEMIRMPHDVVARGIERLAHRNVILLKPTAVVIKNFLVAHEVSKSDRQRQKESRETRLAVAMARGADPASARAAARPDRYGGSQSVTISGHETCPPGHDGSQRVTAGHSVLCCAEQSEAEQYIAGGAGGGSGSLAAGPPAAPAKRSKKARPSEPTADELAVIERVVAKLNERTGREYEPGCKQTRAKVLALLRAGRSERDIRLVIWHKANRWAGDERWSEFLRPKTLFGAENFADYVVEARAAWASSPDNHDVRANGTRDHGAPPGAVLAALAAAKEGG